MIPKMYEELFIEQAIVGLSNFKIKHENNTSMNMLQKRRNYLNKKFIQTPEISKKVIQIQDIFTQKIKMCVEYTKILEVQILHTMKESNADLDEYYIEFRVSLFAPKKYVHILEMEGKPYYSFKEVFVENTNIEDDSPFDYTLPPEFTAFTKNHPLQGIHHNMLMHDLFDHHDIVSYSDILDVEEIWIEPIIRLQNTCKVF
ncbi:MAG TPA: hypothetical protein PK029_03550 [Bacteroidales bacterium]|nr:hypothetical protein [Bacteroidales bacterium]